MILLKECEIATSTVIQSTKELLEEKSCETAKTNLFPVRCFFQHFIDLVFKIDLLYSLFDFESFWEINKKHGINQSDIMDFQDLNWGIGGNT